MAKLIDSFCYGLKEAALVTAAKDKAKESGKPFSKYLLDLIEKDLKKNNNEAMGALANLNLNNILMANKQTTLDVFAKITEINSFIDETQDVQALQQMKKNAHVIEAVARTKLIKISKGLLKVE